MQVTVLKAGQLTFDHDDAWKAILSTNPALDSPFFRPEFTRAVGAVRDDVEVGVFSDRGSAVGFFPYQRGARNVGRPVGGPLSDFQGVIARPGLKWSASELIKECRLTAWHFDHLVAAQPEFGGHQWTAADSPYMDLRGGFEQYRQSRHQAGCSQFAKIDQKLRKLAREVGPVRFEADTQDPRVWNALLEWKSEQYRRTEKPDVFANQWTVDLLHRLQDDSTEDFGGKLSALYAGDQLAAVHFGMQAKDVMHSWFPAYNGDLSKYSPGAILFSEIARAAQVMNVSRIDLGKGEQRFKHSFMSGAFTVLKGVVDLRLAGRAGSILRNMHRAKMWIRSSALYRPARACARLMHVTSLVNNFV